MGFGQFDSICEKTPMPLCLLVGPASAISGDTGIVSNCYARNIEVANTMIFQGAASFMHIIALGMTVIMILHIRSKFTAVGRKEIITLFYLYLALTICSLIIDAGVVPPRSGSFPYFVAIQSGLVSALCTCLLVNGFVGFQLYEDGTALSVWLIRIPSALMFAMTFVISLLTFKSWGGLGPENTVGLFVVLYLFNAISIAIYVVMQLLLVLNTLDDRWPLGHICFGVAVFIIGQVLLYAFSDLICNNVQHYLDGLFFATFCNLLAVMMIYKFWDSITTEDLEFSVGVKPNSWEIKELLPEEDHRQSVYHDNNSEYGGYGHQRASSYGHQY
ncbi:Chitin synthase export chaperone [Penicillium chermesinum]|uniref:Chitin synthase export chaperone n=1 Tax=Penicillium chermesinum TaxID=63820 RepID=A0A9W9TKN7_9EURO|nr:Chitin synthase export chaperone [Penicillium chermesinum]KAJ5226218.1 Chitin synthase export chaperone [Penicillium chermesinum]KAJ6160597.1 Chitin synthase export chaperone [Penicillium chermesinum]